MTIEESWILEQQKKYEKMKMEYNEVGRNKLMEKYEDLEHLMYSIYTLIEDGYKYRKLGEKNDKRNNEEKKNKN